MAAIQNLSIVTYNSHGHGAGRLDYIRSLASNNDILLLQEHWLFNSQSNVLEMEVPTCNVHLESGMQNHDLLQGRPYGGCAILWKRNLDCVCVPIKFTSNRVCAVSITMNNVTLLIVNVYMPCDSLSVTEQSREFQNILDEISGKCEETNIDNVIIGGDFNTDFSRLRSLNTNALKVFMQSEELKCPLFHELFTIDFTFESKANGERSTIDHFLLTENLYNYVADYHVLHDGLNMSDHSAIKLSLEVATLHHIEKSDVGISRPSWHLASEENIDAYKRSLSDTLNDIRVPWEAIHCSNVFCAKHSEIIQEYHDSIVKACIESGLRHIPHTSAHKAKIVPGWNEHVESLKQQALFWHFLWKSNKRPREGIIAEIRRKTRARYHQAIRYVKANKEKMSAQYLAESLAKHNVSEFWRNVKKIRKNKQGISTTVDDESNDEKIADLFADKFDTLYNSVSYDKTQMEKLKSQLDDLILSNNNSIVDRLVSIEKVKLAVKTLKCGKHDGHTGHYSDHIIHGSDNLYVHMSLLFRAMITHGYAPSGLLNVSVYPIPKNNRKSLNDSENYRGIALGSVIGKVLDWVILNDNRDVLDSSNLQFGFKPGSSTTQCTFVVSECINYYLQHGSNTHVVFLDASKAFDRVEYVKLFSLLIHKGLDPIICRLLLNMYTNQNVKVKWRNAESRSFSCTNGVKQGGVLSPILFGVYIDELLTRLKDSGFGCHIGNIFAGAVAYADDVALLAPTTTSMSKLLSICTSYSEEYEINFNPAKSKSVFFDCHNTSCPSSIQFNEENVEQVNSYKHLGNIIGTHIAEENIRNYIRIFNGEVNVLMSQFKYIYSTTRYNLFKTYCMSLFGCQLWDFSGKEVQLFYTAWRKAIRFLWKLPPRCHNNLLHLVCDDLDIEVQLHKRFLKFFYSLYHSRNTIVCSLAKQVIGGSRSSVCNSLNYILSKYGIPKQNFRSHVLPELLSILRNYHQGTNHLITTANSIREVCEIRDGSLISNLSKTECNELLNYLCTI